MFRRFIFAILSLIFLFSSALQAREVVALDGYRPGSIVISTQQRRLYFVLGSGLALQYKVGVGKPGKQWSGLTYIAEKRVWPSWSPPESVKRVEPNLPDVVPPGPKNPMGSRALLLAGDEYAIHGTNKPESIGGFVSFGCIRMHNHDVEELYNYVRVGTPVMVMR